MSSMHDAPPEPAGDDEELFAEFANAFRLRDGPAHDPIANGSALRDWLASRGMLRADSSDVAIERALPDFRELRSLIHAFTGRLVEKGSPSPTQVQRLNRVLRQGLHYHQLRTEDGGSRFSVGQVGDELDQARAAIAGSLAHFVADHDVGRLRICADDQCAWRFIDRSPAGRRRWCDMRTCGNRAKVARHRARARATC
jgi:predicted RNA-binding Zn ribbon-like protein